MTEAQWQRKVVDLATYCGWLSYHPYDSRRSTAGWPDLAMVRKGRLVLAELKSEHGRVTPEQRQWLAALSACPGTEVFVWRPSQWADVQRVLLRPERNAP